jgi:tetratricopeptide (TPR) repeat protein
MKGKIALALILFLVFFVTYAFTLCPTIYWEDSAAFATAGTILGIPHSPGFPLYVNWGRIFSLIPLNNYAWRVNLSSAFWGGLAVALLYLLTLKVISFKEDERNGFIENVVSLGSAIIFGFSSAFWLQTIRAEVYSLNIFLSLLLIYLFILWQKNFRFEYLALATFIFGLSLTNHSLLIFGMLPTFLFFLIFHFKKWFNPQKLSLLLFLFSCGISLYLYLLIRSQWEPAINWGRPNNWQKFLQVITRSQSLAKSVESISAPYENRFWFNLTFSLKQYGILAFSLGILGLVEMFRTKRKIAFYLFSLFLFNIFIASWSANFSLRNLDLQGYLLLSLSLFSVFIALAGFRIVLLAKKFLEKSVSSGKMVLQYGLIVLLLGMSAFLFQRNYGDSNRRNFYFAYDYAKEVLDSVEEDGVVLTTTDNTLTTLWYLNYAEKYRKDVKIISSGNLIQESYREQIKKQYPEVQLPPLKQNLPKQDYAFLFCQENVKKFPIYYEYGTFDTVFTEHLVPLGYLAQYSEQAVSLTDSILNKQLGFLRMETKKIDEKDVDIITKEHWGNLVFNWGVYFNRTSFSPASWEFFNLALEVDSSNPRIYAQLAKGFYQVNQIENAIKFFEAATELDPYDYQNYYYLGICFAQIKDFEKSKAALQQSLKLNPHNREAKELWQQIGKGLS